MLSQHGKEIFMSSKLQLKDENLVVKPNFCSPPTLSGKPRSNHFVYIGRLSADKGVNVLLNAFSTSPYQLVIAGDGPLKEKVISYTERFPNITYKGLLDKVAVTEILQEGTAMIFPSIWHEGMPLTIIEGLACGTPVIASDLGVMKHMITHDHDGLLVEPNNAKALREAVNRWAALDVCEKETFSGNARSTYELHYTPAKNVEQLLAVYRSVHTDVQQPSLAIAG